MILIHKNIVAVVIATVCIAAVTASAAGKREGKFKVVQKIPLEGGGRWDYLLVDPQTRRLYMSRATHVAVLDADSGKVIGDIPDTPGVHGIALAPDLGVGFISNGGEDKVAVFDLKTLEVSEKIGAGGNPDSMVYYAPNHTLFVQNGKGGTSTVIDAKTRKVLATIPVGGRPEFTVYDDKGNIYMNLEDKSSLAVVDAATKMVKSTWPLAPCEEPTGLAIDKRTRTLFTACANKMLAIVNADSGKVVQTLPIGSSDPPDPKLAEYLASINLSKRDSWDFPLRPFARPKGIETHVIVTEYDLPGPSLPHDVAVGKDGAIWYDDFQRPLIGKLDSRTGSTREWDLQVLRPEFPRGLLSIKIDRQGDAWVPRFFQGCTLIKLDTKSFKITTWKVPNEFDGPKSRCGHVALGAPDGSVWMSDSGGRKMFRLDPVSGHFETFESFPGYNPGKNATSIETAGKKSKGHRTYGIGVDSQGNAYFADISGGAIGRLDAKTGEVKLFPTPTPSSGPRRTYMDSQDKYWFGENYSSKIGMFDTKTNQFREWTPPVPWNGAYPTVRDKNEDVWTVGMSTDYVFRLNPATGSFTKFLLPTLGSNLRRVDADNTAPNVTIWVAEVHQGKIAKIEPLP